MSKSLIQEIKINREKKDNYVELKPEILNEKKERVLNKFILLAFITIIIIGGIYWYSKLFTFAKVNIVAKTQEVVLDKENFIAEKNACFFRAGNTENSRAKMRGCFSFASFRLCC